MQIPYVGGAFWSFHGTFTPIISPGPDWPGHRDDETEA